MRTCFHIEAQRARVVLLATHGVANYLIAEGVGVTRPTGELVAGPLGPQQDGRLGGGEASGPAAVGGPGRDRHRHVDLGTDELGSDALVVAAAGALARVDHATV